MKIPVIQFFKWKIYKSLIRTILNPILLMLVIAVPINGQNEIECTGELPDKCQWRQEHEYDEVNGICITNCFVDCIQGDIHSVTGGSFSEGNWRAKLVDRNIDNFDFQNNCFREGVTINLQAEFKINLPLSECENQENQSNSDVLIFTYLFRNNILIGEDYNIQILDENLEGNYIYNIDNDRKVEYNNYYIYCDLLNENTTEYAVPYNDPYVAFCNATVKVSLNNIDLSETSTIRRMNMYDPVIELVFIIIDEDHGNTFEEDLRTLQDVNCNIVDKTFNLSNLKKLDESDCGHINEHISIIQIPICQLLGRPSETNATINFQN